MYMHRSMSVARCRRTKITNPTALVSSGRLAAPQSVSIYTNFVSSLLHQQSTGSIHIKSYYSLLLVRFSLLRLQSFSPVHILLSVVFCPGFVATGQHVVDPTVKDGVKTHGHRGGEFQRILTRFDCAKPVHRNRQSGWVAGSSGAGLCCRQHQTCCFRGRQDWLNHRFLVHHERHVRAPSQIDDTDNWEPEVQRNICEVHELYRRPYGPARFHCRRKVVLNLLLCHFHSSSLHKRTDCEESGSHERRCKTHIHRNLQCCHCKSSGRKYTLEDIVPEMKSRRMEKHSCHRHFGCAAWVIVFSGTLLYLQLCYAISHKKERATCKHFSPKWVCAQSVFITLPQCFQTTKHHLHSSQVTSHDPNRCSSYWCIETHIRWLRHPKARFTELLAWAHFTGGRNTSDPCTQLKWSLASMSLWQSNTKRRLYIIWCPR